jgi:hypothetical protein
MKKKNWIIVIAAVISVVMLLFPPFQGQKVFRSSSYDSPDHYSKITNLGYHFLFSPPNLGTINTSMLIIQLVVVWLILTAVWFLWKK